MKWDFSKFNFANVTDENEIDSRKSQSSSNSENSDKDSHEKLRIHIHKSIVTNK